MSMHKITVTKGKFVVARYFNRDPEQGLETAKAQHSDKCDFRVEPA